MSQKAWSLVGVVCWSEQRLPFRSALTSSGSSVRREMSSLGWAARVGHAEIGAHCCAGVRVGWPGTNGAAAGLSGGIKTTRVQGVSPANALPGQPKPGLLAAASGSGRATADGL